MVKAFGDIKYFKIYILYDQKHLEILKCGVIEGLERSFGKIM
jgi:hypothetical protein